jgi:hypothetical protein
MGSFSNIVRGYLRLEDMIANLIHVFKSMRDNPLFRYSRFVFCPEAAPATTADSLEREIRREFNNTVFTVLEGDSHGDTVGCQKHIKQTTNMTQKFSWALKTRTVRIYKDCKYFTNDSIPVIKGQKREDAVKEYLHGMLREQLLAIPTDPSKFAQKDGQNDSAIAEMMPAEWLSVFYNKYEYLGVRTDFSRVYVVDKSGKYFENDFSKSSHPQDRVQSVIDAAKPPKRMRLSMV